MSVLCCMYRCVLHFMMLMGISIYEIGLLPFNFPHCILISSAKSSLPSNVPRRLGKQNLHAVHKIKLLIFQLWPVVSGHLVNFASIS